MRTSLVTGCSAGIGRAIANRLRDAGYLVVGVQRRGPGIKADLGDYRKIPGVWRSVVDELGRAPDLVVLNAGRCIAGTLTEMSFEDCISIIELNLLSPLLLAREILKTWVEKESCGHLVFIGSQAALPGARHAGEVAYTASKGGIHSIIGPLATEYGPRIRVNGVAPGNVATTSEFDLTAQCAAKAGRTFRELKRSITATTPLRRWIRPREVAEAVMFLETCRAMSGAVINLTGGRSAH
jgi:NAD(P)-dependent dehydrogenase (short-subunit alcohol dehydrogenase family)